MDVRLALTGFGNVGKGVAELLRDSGDEYERTYGLRLSLTGVADRGGAAVDPEGLDPASLLAAKAYEGSIARHARGLEGLKGREFLAASRAQVLIEAASTNFDDAEPGWTYIRDALDLGMDLVLASKGALVLFWDQLMELVRERHARLYFAGTVGAPLPVLEVADRMLPGARIDSFEGLVNGTTNYILSAMGRGASYEEGVTLAQEAGIAETDPTLDVDGWDAAAKAVIVANAILGGHLRLEDVRRESVRTVAPQQLEDALENRKRVKFVAHAQRTNGGVEAWVGPEARAMTDALGALDGMQMGFVFEAPPLGRVTATVEQTGGIPTALTVLRDVVNLARDRGWTRSTGE